MYSVVVLLRKEIDMRWFTSDLHIGHNNILRYCDRPFKDMDEMIAYMIKDWNDKVKPEDTVYLMGDVALNHNRAFGFIKLVTGTKILVMGNHDSCWHKSNKKQLYLDNGFSEVWKDTKITLSDGKSVRLNHFPYRDSLAEQYDKRYLEHRPINVGDYLLHGHMHNKYLKSGRTMDVGYEHKLSLYTEQEVIDILNDEREYIPSRITEFYSNRKDKNGEAY